MRIIKNQTIRTMPPSAPHLYEQYLCLYPFESESRMVDIFTALGPAFHKPTTCTIPQRYSQTPFDSAERDEDHSPLPTASEITGSHGTDRDLSQVIEGPIHFYSQRDHQDQPLHGHAYIGYIAHMHIIDLGKLTHLVRLFARQFTEQERIGQQIADILEAMLEPYGVVVYLETQRLYSETYKEWAIAPFMRTTFWTGIYDESMALRNEFFALCGVHS